MRKILVSAYGCEPFRGSEAGVGWNWILQMARHNEMYVIARKNDKNKIEDNIPEEIKVERCEIFRRWMMQNKKAKLYDSIKQAYSDEDMTVK